MADEQVVFGLKVDADAEPAVEAAASLEKFRASIEKSQDAIKNYQKSQSLLKGSSDEVKDAKAKLKAAIEAERAAITKNNLGILKLNGSYDKLNKKHKESKNAFEAGKKAIDATGGPIKELSDKFATLKSVLGGVTTGWGLVAVAAAAGIAGIIAAGAAIGAIVINLAKFTIESADALRNMNLMREAVSGNTTNATAWGHQIDQIALKLATSKDELNEMVVALEKSLRGTRVSGQGMVDIFQAVASASAAMGKDTGKALEDILTRGKLTGRLSIGFKAPGISELQGTGITFQQVAAQLAKDLNVSTATASRALQTGSVRLDAGAKAVREVVENRFATINAKKLDSLGSIFTKLQDNARDWAQDLIKDGGALEPILKGLKSLVDMTGLQTESGQKLKRTITEYATALSNAFVRNLPLMKSVVSTIIDIGAGFVHALSAVIDFARSTTGLLLIKSVLAGIAAVAAIIAVSFLPVAVAVAAVGAAIIAVGALIYGLYSGVKALINLDWASIGRAIVDGIENGLLAAWNGLKNAVTSIGTGIKNQFKSILGIASPSKVFSGYGKMTGAGYVQGLESSKDDVQAATVQMVSVPKTESPGATNTTNVQAAAPTVTPTINIEFNISGMGAEKAAALIKSDSFLEKLSHQLEVVFRSQGIPTGMPATSGG